MQGPPQPPPYGRVPMEGVVDPTVPLVPAHAPSNIVQVAAAAVGTLGGALLGAALGPLIAVSNVPAEGLQGLAKACTDAPARCQDLVALPARQSGLNIALAIVGGVLVTLQVFLVLVMLWPKKPQGDASNGSSSAPAAKR
jgi:hypothetical protein